MHIEYIKTKTSTGKLSHTCILLRQTYRVNGKVKKKTIANLTHVPPEVLGSYKALIKYQKHPEILVSTKEDIKTNAGKSIGAAWTLFMVAKKLHIDEVLGTGRPGKLALYQILSRCLAQGSRLSAIRLNQIHELTNTLGIDFSFHEDHLYKNLFFLFNKQKQFEQELFEKTYEGKAVPDLFLYDVTSSYFEGDQNELSAWGYNRDKKRGKKQVVMGLLCDKDGEAVSVHVFSGNTTDIKTFHSQVEKIKQEFGCQRVTCVTDRGIMKGKQIEELKENDYFYITAITKAQIDHLLKKDVL
jgi:hypothetical protein